MPTRIGGKWRLGVVLWGLAVTAGLIAPARGEDGPSPPSVAPAAAAPTPSVEQLAERLRKMEETNRKLAEQLERSTR